MFLIITFFFLILFPNIISYQSLLNQKDFQIELEGKKTDLYYLTNENGVEISITNYGGIIVSIMVPNKFNQYDNIIQGYTTLNEYIKAQKKDIKINSLLGRYSNKIKNEEFILDKKVYKLNQNNNFGEKVWTAVQINENELRMYYTSEDGENGFPGKLHVEVIYCLNNNNELIISYTGITTKKTVINLSHRLFVNLSGNNNNNKLNTIKDHILDINSKLYLPYDENKIPLGDIKLVDNTIYDFNLGKKIGEQKLDNFFVLNNNNYINDKYSAKLEEKKSGRIMMIYTTEPGLDIYTNNNSISIEPKHFPNSPNVGFFPSTILNPGNIYTQKTKYKFSIINN